MRRCLGLVAVLATVTLVTGCGGGGAPRFEAAAGWHLLSGNGEVAAANVPFAGEDRSLASPPSRTVATLPRGGVVIWAMLTRAGAGSPRPLPLHLSAAARTDPFEGLRCAPAVPMSRCYAASGSVRRLAGRMDGYDVDVSVFFGIDHPSSAQIAAASAELARLTL